MRYGLTTGNTSTSLRGDTQIRKKTTNRKAAARSAIARKKIIARSGTKNLYNNNNNKNEESFANAPGKSASPGLGRLKEL